MCIHLLMKLNYMTPQYTFGLRKLILVIETKMFLLFVFVSWIVEFCLHISFKSINKNKAYQLHHLLSPSLSYCCLISTLKVCLFLSIHSTYCIGIPLLVVNSMNALFNSTVEDQIQENGSFNTIRRVTQKYIVSIRKKQRKQFIDEKRKIVSLQKQKDIQQLISFPSLQYLGSLADETHRFHLQMIYEKQFDISNLPRLIQHLSDSDVLKNYQGCIGIAKLLNNSNDSHIQAIIDQGIVPKLRKLLKYSQQPALEYISLFIINNIIDEDSFQSLNIVEKGILPVLLDEMRSEHEKIVQQAMVIIGNLAQFCSRSTVFITSEPECISILIDTAIRIGKDKINFLSCWVLSTICEGTSLVNFHQIKPAFAFICLNLIKIDRIPSIYLKKCLQALYLHTIHPMQIGLFLKFDDQTNIIDKLCKSKQSLLDSLRLICNLSTIPKGQSKLLECDIIKQLEILIYHQQQSIRKEVLYILTNLAFNSSKIVQYFINIKSIQLAFKAMQIMQNDKYCKRQAAKFLIAFSNVGNPDKVSRFYNQYEMFERYWSLLQINPQKEIKIVALRCLYKLLQIGERVKWITDNINLPLSKLLGNNKYITYLQDLQYSPSNEIDREVKRILQLFCNLQEESIII